MPTLADGAFSDRVHECLQRLHIHTQDTVIPEPGIRLVETQYSYNEFSDVFAARTKSVYRIVDDRVTYSEHTIAFQYLPSQLPISPISVPSPHQSPSPSPVNLTTSHPI